MESSIPHLPNELWAPIAYFTDHESLKDPAAGLLRTFEAYNPPHQPPYSNTYPTSHPCALALPKARPQKQSLPKFAITHVGQILLCPRLPARLDSSPRPNHPQALHGKLHHRFRNRSQQVQQEPVPLPIRNRARLWLGRPFQSVHEIWRQLYPASARLLSRFSRFKRDYHILNISSLAPVHIGALWGEVWRGQY
ncbi:hypothetical protein GX48_06690 [Paracoccidioides brasiliensis]|nr:hypothetical protein GX48_06690 [Paracoccidioides brasiliensis]